jgi:hypothetical protein
LARIPLDHAATVDEVVLGEADEADVLQNDAVGLEELAADLARLRGIPSGWARRGR